MSKKLFMKDGRVGRNEAWMYYPQELKDKVTKELQEKRKVKNF